MKVSYYPGCSLRGTERSTANPQKLAMKALGVELVELDDWSCCGASSAHSAGKELAVEVAARNLLIAKDSGLADTTDTMFSMLSEDKGRRIRI